MKKGFTLIELLAVIVILAIISLIAVPIVVNIINDSKKSSKEQSIEMYGSAVEKAVSNYLLKYPDKKNITLKDLENEKLINYTGERVECDIVSIRSNGKIYLAECSVENTNVDYTYGEKIWITKEDGTITDGIVNLNIGDYIAYDHTKNKEGITITGDSAKYISYSASNQSDSLNNGRTNGGTGNCQFVLGNYTGGWRVLGVEDYNLKLISAGSIGNLTLYGKKGYIYGEEELDAISSIYGKGKGAISSRSVKDYDINEVTGYDPKKTGNGEVRAKGRMWEYGNKVTYYWENNKVKCSSINGLKYSSNYSVFKYYNEETSDFIELDKKESIEIISNSYNYYPTTLTESSSGSVKGLEKTTKEYNLLFSFNYWISSKFVGTGESNVGYGLFQINNKRLYDSNLFDAITVEKSYSLGVRPVIIIASNTKIIKNKTNDGSTKDKACVIN